MNIAAGKLGLKIVRFAAFIILFIVVFSCGKSTVTLAPPDWIQGTWQSESGDAEPEYVIWIFTADNAVYEYHDTVNNVHSTIDLQTDVTDKWIRDEVSEDAYEILIDRHTYGFYPQLDETTGQIDDPTILDYSPSGVFDSRSWELTKQ